MIKRHGFTLSELLIALAILGLIAAFAIPKVLQNVETQQNKSNFKEAYSVIATAFTDIVMQSRVTSTTDLGPLLSARLNFLKYCSNNGESEGCWNSGIQGVSVASETDEAVSFVLHNNVQIMGLGDDTNNGKASSCGTDCYQSEFLIDVNGTTGPNTPGSDQIQMVFCFGPNNTCDAPATGYTGKSGLYALYPKGTSYYNTGYLSLIR